MKINGSEILVNCLLEQGVDTIFGFPGGAVLNIYDALYKYRDKIRHILTSHEQGASHAADGYARATGKVGVCLATSGPGATNLVTGIATAYMDSIPMVAITGNVALGLIGKDSFQEVDITGITMPITKHNFIVKDVNDLAGIVRQAFYIAKEGRPGPVLIDIPKDISAAVTEYEPEKPKTAQRKIESIRQKDLDKAVEILGSCRKPLIYMGGGVVISDASEELLTFAETIDAPVCSSLMGLGGIPGEHERFIGMIGMHGTKTANLAATDCDILIAIGARFSDRVVSNVKRFAPSAMVLHLDIDPAEINKNIKAYHSVTGDVKEILTRLNNKLKKQDRSKWMSNIEGLKKLYPIQYPDNGELRGQYVIERLYELTKDKDVIIATEVGQHQMWTAQYYKFDKPRKLLTSGGLGTMGYGFGAAMGAQVAYPEKRVINIAGDGCFRMNCNELATAVHYNIPVIIVILNNHVLGMVRQWQTLFYAERYSQTDIDRQTDFVKLAESYHAAGFNITKKEEVDEVIKKALTINGPVIINCEISKDEKVFPMVAPGAGIDELITDEDIV